MTFLDNTRKKIDSLDNCIIDLLAKRMSLMPSLARFKKKNKMKISDPKRESKMLIRRKETAKNKNLNSKFIQKLFKLIMAESKRIQNRN